MTQFLTLCSLLHCSELQGNGVGRTRVEGMDVERLQLLVRVGEVWVLPPRLVASIGAVGVGCVCVCVCVCECVLCTFVYCEVMLLHYVQRPLYLPPPPHPHTTHLSTPPPTYPPTYISQPFPVTRGGRTHQVSTKSHGQLPFLACSEHVCTAYSVHQWTT